MIAQFGKFMNIKEIWKAANPKGHLLTAISYLIPIVCGAGFIIAIGMALGGTVQDTLVPGHFDLWQVLATLGAKALGLALESGAPDVRPVDRDGLTVLADLLGLDYRPHGVGSFSTDYAFLRAMCC